MPVLKTLIDKRLHQGVGYLCRELGIGAVEADQDEPAGGVAFYLKSFLNFDNAILSCGVSCWDRPTLDLRPSTRSHRPYPERGFWSSRSLRMTATARLSPCITWDWVSRYSASMAPEPLFSSENFSPDGSISTRAVAS